MASASLVSEVDDLRTMLMLLEARFDDAKRRSRDLDARLLSVSGDAPLVWITGDARGRAKQVLCPGSSEEDAVVPLVLDCKYYTANVLVVTGEKMANEERQDAIILALNGAFDANLASSVFESTGDVRLCICDDASAQEWCIDEGVELVSWTETARIQEALLSSTWSNMVMKPRDTNTTKTASTTSKSSDKVTQAKASGDKQKDARSQKDADLNIESFERLLLKARQTKESAGNVDDETRRERAAKAIEEIIQALNLDIADDDDDI